MGGELVPAERKEPAPAEIVFDDEGTDGQETDARRALAVGYVMGASAAMSRMVREECAAREAERLAEQKQREAKYAALEAEGEETRRRVEAFLALSEEEGNALFGKVLARNYAQSVADICSSLRALAADTGVPDSQLVQDPDLFIVIAIHRETGRRMKFILDGETLGFEERRS